MNDIKVMNHAADNIRILAASMVEKANSGHPGGAMGGSDFINVLFSEYLVYDPSDPTWTGRDRFFLDPGHMSPMLYAGLALRGFFSMEDLKQFRQWGSVTPGHPELDLQRGIENSSGPLGQGHALAAGAAVAEKFLEARLGSTMMQHKIYAYISDGAVEEEISQGVGRIAGNLGLNNLIMFYDSNDIQLSTECGVVMNEDTEMKYKAWGWNVIKINGNDVAQIREALDAAQKEQNRPTLIIGKTVMGKGALRADGTSYEACINTHGAPLGGDAYVNTIKHLGGDPENAFVIFDDVKEIYAKRAEELKKIVAERKAAEAKWRKANPEKAAQMDEWFSGKAPKVDWSKVEQKAGSATRAASAACLGVLAEQVPNMICASADLSNSDKTDGFLKKTKSIVRGDFSGAFFQAGVAELTMADMCIGMMLHGGVVAAMGTFFVFSDYTKPMARLSSIMGVPLTFVFTHDSIGVGEDGPTHEPIEQLAMWRAMPNFHMFRPADATETAAAWYSAITSKRTPTALALTRQNLPQIEGTSREALKGGYIVQDSKKAVPDAIIIASGSELSLAVEAKKVLAEDGIDVRVVSMPCMDIFEEQSEEYKAKVLPKNVRKRVAVEALSGFGWDRYVGLDGDIIGMNRFGASAPYSKLFPYFGFTVENVVARVKAL